MTANSLSRDPVRLSRIVRAIEPRARLLPARQLRRVLRRHFDLASGVHVPHGICLEIDREELLKSIDADVLVDAGELPERVLLLPLPDDEASAEPVIRDLSRRLFHAAIDRAVDTIGGSFDDDPVLFNATVLHEIRAVLDDADRLASPDDNGEAYREFVSYYLELLYFSPSLIEIHFPGFLHLADVSRRLKELIETDALFKATQLEGQASLDRWPNGVRRQPENHARPPNAVQIVDLEARAQRSAEAGNDVRAAIFHRQAGNSVAAGRRLDHLIERFKTIVHADDAAATAWREALRPVLEKASDGFWPVAGRMLYEIQKACLDCERKECVFDPVEWFYTRGQKPLKRVLDKPRDIHVLRRLHAAVKYARRTQLTAEQHAHLDGLLHHAIVEVEKQIRQCNRPILSEVLDDVGVAPTNQAERIARQKLVEEMLDVLCERGFLKMSDLRDAIARNRVKLDDVTGPIDFLHGGPVIRANHQLSVRMDGVYRRGEIYLRVFQRGSTLAFGTATGRAIMLFLVFPFGGAFVLLEGLHHFIGAMRDLIHFLEIHIVKGHEAPAHHGQHEQHASFMTSQPAIIATGLLLLALIHLPVFRRTIVKYLRIVLIDVPIAILQSPLVHLLFDNFWTRIFARYLLTPLVAGSLVAIGMRFLHYHWEQCVSVGAGVAALMYIGFRTPWGRGLEERLDEWLAQVWRVVSVNFLIGLLMLIVQFFTRILEYIEKGMYFVDEWMSFREGESWLSTVFKLVFGTIWSIFAYVFRFAWNLLAEPQVNPVKHFPVVTVSHKILLPMVPSLAESFGMPPGTIFWIVFFIPGVFGFLVWELKENWRLFRANSPRSVGPVQVGSHGEQVRALLRPGFHSGAIPKTYAKLRKAEAAGNHARSAKLHHYLEHLGDSLHHLAGRTLVASLSQSRRWRELQIKVEKIRLATNRLRVPLSSSELEGRVIISIEERGGWLIGSIEERGWSDQLDHHQHAAFQDALTAFYKLAGVHVTREQASAVLGIAPYRLDCRDLGLVVLAHGCEPEIDIDWWDEPVLTPTVPQSGQQLVPIPARDLILSERPLHWGDWVERCELDAAGKGPLESLLGGYRVL